MKIPLFLGVCAAILAASTVARAADIEAGEAYFNKRCAICHGKTAKGKGSFPALKDRDADYLTDRLETYRARGKVGPNSALMYAHAKKLDDERIADIAAYLEAAFGAPKPGKEPAEAKPQSDEDKQPEASVKPSGEPVDVGDEITKITVIACAQEQGEALGECAYRVKHGKAGETTITATFANGFERKLFFRDGEFHKASATMSGVGTDTDWSLDAGLHRIRVDDQRYEIPAALVAIAEPAASTTKTDTVEAAGSIDLAKGKKHFRKNCRACHGSKAQGVASYPRLAGQPADYLVKRLKQYRAGEKLGPNTPLMAPRAKKLSDEDIDDIVAYIGSFD